MSVDFFNTACKEPDVLTNTKFGICDDQDGTKAYTSSGSSSIHWIATVINQTEIKVTFKQLIIVLLF